MQITPEARPTRQFRGESGKLVGIESGKRYPVRGVSNVSSLRETLPSTAGRQQEIAVTTARLAHDGKTYIERAGADIRSAHHRSRGGMWRAATEEEAFEASLAWREQVRNRDTQRPGENLEGAQCHVTLAAFNRANVGSMKPAGFSKRFLRKLVLLSKRADVVGESFSELGGRLSHELTALK
jgi:hypothetical protein